MLQVCFIGQLTYASRCGMIYEAAGGVLCEGWISRLVKHILEGPNGVV